MSKASLSEAERTFIKQNLPLMFTWRNIDLNTGFVESLLNSGEWRIIRNAELQELLPGVSAEAKALNRQLDYFRDWAVVFLPETVVRNKVIVRIDSISEFDHSSVQGTEQTAVSMWSHATDEDLLTDENRGAITALLAARLNFIGSIEKTLEKAQTLRDLLDKEASNHPGG